MPLKMTFKNGEMAQYLRIEDGTEVDTLTGMQGRAMREAENFLNHDFSTKTITWDGTIIITPVEAPPEVKDWVKDRVLTIYDNRGNIPPADFSTLKPLRVSPMRVDRI